jgi:thioesterase domain-containing protein
MLIPAELGNKNISIENIANELKNALFNEVTQEKYIVGGLSFGATIVFELALQLEELGRLERVIMIEPRHLPHFTAPKDPAPFEVLLQQYAPSQKLNSEVLLIQTKIMPLETQSEIMIESSRSFQDDQTVITNARNICNKEIGSVIFAGQFFVTISDDRNTVTKQ